MTSESQSRNVQQAFLVPTRSLSSNERGQVFMTILASNSFRAGRGCSVELCAGPDRAAGGQAGCGLAGDQAAGSGPVFLHRTRHGHPLRAGQAEPHRGYVHQVYNSGGRGRQEVNT